jgi:hypothetical protein
MSEDIPDVESVEITIADIKAKLKTLVIPAFGHKQLAELFKMGDHNHSQTIEKEELKQLFIEKVCDYLCLACITPSSTFVQITNP